jgi:hypothetical protein
MPALLPSRVTNSVAALSAYAVVSLGRTRSRWCETVPGSKSLAGRGSDLSGSDRTDPALKMPVAEAIGLLQLVDRTVLEGMGPPTVGFNARSELPDRSPRSIGCVSRSNLRGDADFLKNELRLGVAVRCDCLR